jgi:hypothetical protein
MLSFLTSKSSLAFDSQIKSLALSVRSKLAAKENREAGGSTLSTLRLPQLSDDDVCDVMLLTMLNEVRSGKREAAAKKETEDGLGGGVLADNGEG